MNKRDDFDLTPEQQRAGEAVRSLPRVAPDPEFRRRLKEEFVEGSLVDRREPHIEPRVRRRWPLLVPVAAALLLVVATILNRGPSLELSDIAGEGTVTAGGTAIPTSDREAIRRAVRPGERIELSDGVQIDLVYRRTAAIQLTSAVATIPKAPARWIGKTVTCRLESGEFQVITGPGFRGGRMVIETQEGEIRLIGTVVSVVRGDFGTCVCVYRGTAVVGTDEEDMETIPAGQRKVMFSDGKPPIVTPIAKPHEEHLIEFEKKYRDGIRPVH